MALDPDLDLIADVALVSVLRLLLARGGPGAGGDPLGPGLSVTSADLDELERAVRRERGTGVVGSGAGPAGWPSDEARRRRRAIDRAWLHVEAFGIAALRSEAAERTASGFRWDEGGAAPRGT